MQLRYSYRLYPDAAQRQALARAFGCARVVFNDALAARREAYEAGLSYISDAALSARLTAAKKTPHRAWLDEVSAVVLQQALADLNEAYRNFFASVTGKRKGPKVGPPKFRSRKDSRQEIRFTRNARFKVLANGRLRLPKIGDIPVRWSRPLPSDPSSVTVMRDAAGRYFASFVVEVTPAPLQEAGAECGIDLGLRHFAVLDDGTKITAPRFLRRAEKKLKRDQRDLSRKQQESKNRDKARVKVARAHAKVADARRDFSATSSPRRSSAITSGVRGGPGGQRPGAHKDGQVGARCRLVGVHGDAGIQGRPVRAHLPEDRPVRADQPDMLGVRGQGRSQAAACPRVDVRWVRDYP